MLLPPRTSITPHPKVWRTVLMLNTGKKDPIIITITTVIETLSPTIKAIGMILTSLITTIFPRIGTHPPMTTHTIQTTQWHFQEMSYFRHLPRSKDSIGRPIAPFASERISEDYSLTIKIKRGKTNFWNLRSYPPCTFDSLIFSLRTLWPYNANYHFLNCSIQFWTKALMVWPVQRLFVDNALIFFPFFFHSVVCLVCKRKTRTVLCCREMRKVHKKKRMILFYSWCSVGLSLHWRRLSCDGFSSWWQSHFFFCWRPLWRLFFVVRVWAF